MFVYCTERLHLSEAEAYLRIRVARASRKHPALLPMLEDGTFADQTGRRCTARERLEYHHHDPFGFGGDRSPDNISLMCATHNALMAEREFGKDVMDQYRRSDDRVSEPLPVFYVSAERRRDVLGLEHPFGVG